MGYRAFAALLIFSGACAPAAAAPSERAPLVQTFPSAREFYYPLIADPTELGYSGRYYWRVGAGKYGEITVGDYLGLLRWKLPADWVMQLNIAGGVLARFNMNTTRNALEVTDYTAGAPLDLHRGAHTIRTGLWHTSSHLGDDFIKATGVVVQKRSNDLIKTIYSFTPNEMLRFYGGGSYAFNVVNVGGRGILQCGAELLSPYAGNHQLQLFLAQDLQTLERVQWNPAYTLRAGVRATDSKHIAAAKLFVEYFTGHYYFLQLYEQRESRWGVGISLEIGNPVK